MADQLKGETIAGVAVICGMINGFASFIVAVISIFTNNPVGASVCLIAAGLSFGLVANAALRR